MASLSNIYANSSARSLFSPQYTALTGRKPKIPLSAIIHAQRPAFKATKKAKVERDLKAKSLEEEQKQFEEEMGLKREGLAESKSQFEKDVELKDKALEEEKKQFKEDKKLKEAQMAETQAYHAESQKQAEKATKVSGARTGATIGATAGTAISPGVGTVVGSVVGAVVGYVASGTVLCTELHRQGLLPDEIYQADCEYAKRIPEVVKIGYRMWARYLVLVMQKNSLVTRLLAPFIRAWAYQMAYKMGVVDKGSRLGALLEWAGVPICKVIGEAIVKNLSIIDSAKEKYFNFNMI